MSLNNTTIGSDTYDIAITKKRKNENTGSIEVDVKVIRVQLEEGAKLPNRASKGAAGYDIYSFEDVVIPPGGKHSVRTGFRTEIPEGYCAEIKQRSGHFFNFHGPNPGPKLFVFPGTIDADFRGEWKIGFHNMDDKLPFVINKYDRIAQFLFREAETAIFYITDTLSTSERGEGGFGSTGVGLIAKTQ